MLRRGTGRLALRGPAFRVEPKILLEILRLSAGTVGQFLIATTSWVVLMRILSHFGGTVLAGYTIAIRIVVFAFLPAWGFSNAAAKLVGQNLGARQPERAERAVWLTGFYTMSFLAVVTAVFLLLAPQIVAIFTDHADTAAVAVAALRTLNYGYVFYAWGMASVQGFNGAGDTVTPTWMHFFCFWLFEIPLAWLLANTAGVGAPGVFWSVCLAESLLAIVGILLFRKGRWKSTRSLPTSRRRRRSEPARPQVREREGQHGQGRIARATEHAGATTRHRATCDSQILRPFEPFARASWPELRARAGRCWNPSEARASPHARVSSRQSGGSLTATHDGVQGVPFVNNSNMVAQ
jgi:hypothetical protein